MEINNKRIVITGAASGIGKALLNEISKLDTHILAADINASGLNQAIKDLSGNRSRITPFIADLSLAKNIDKLFRIANNQLGGIDLFIANAGFPYYETIHKADWKHIERIFKLNVYSPIYAFEKLLLLNKRRDFKMVITASAMGVMAMPGYALYSATKAALHRFAEGAHLEMGDPRQLMLVYPIATFTYFFKSASQNTPIPWPAQTPQVVARAILHGIQYDRKTVNPSLIFSLIIFLDRFQPFIRLAYQKYYARLLDKHP
jgi:short-subunit dehydrogenase